MTDRMTKMVNGLLPDGTLIRACEVTFGYLEKQDDRIEKLEAALREAYTLLWKARLYRGYEGGPLSEPIAEMIERNCREALEGKDD